MQQLLIKYKIATRPTAIALVGFTASLLSPTAAFIEQFSATKGLNEVIVAHKRKYFMMRVQIV
jgi:hypothetical protein